MGGMAWSGPPRAGLGTERLIRKEAGDLDRAAIPWLVSGLAKEA